MKYIYWKLEVLVLFFVLIFVIILDKIFDYWCFNLGNIVKFFWGKGLLENLRKFYGLSNIRVGSDGVIVRGFFCLFRKIWVMICYIFIMLRI